MRQIVILVCFECYFLHDIYFQEEENGKLKLMPSQKHRIVSICSIWDVLTFICNKIYHILNKFLCDWIEFHLHIAFIVKLFVCLGLMLMAFCLEALSVWRQMLITEIIKHLVRRKLFPVWGNPRNGMICHLAKSEQYLSLGKIAKHFHKLVIKLF